LWQYRDTWYFGGGGLLFLFTEPDGQKGVGVLLLLLAAFAFLVVRHKNRKKAVTSIQPIQKPEPYADLQAAVARLHETEDKAAAQRRIQHPDELSRAARAGNQEAPQ